MGNKKVALIMGSDSDFPQLKPCIDFLKKFEIDVHVEVCSAHRTPDRAAEFAKSAKDNGFGVIIAAAGMAAHLPGVLAAFTVVPVIGVPIKSKALDGVDALLAMVQMPPGIPVATVAIDGALNSAILAAQILAVEDEKLNNKLLEYKQEMADKVNAKNKALQEKLEEM